MRFCKKYFNSNFPPLLDDEQVCIDPPENYWDWIGRPKEEILAGSV